jgi:hypothetical protein
VTSRRDRSDRKCGEAIPERCHSPVSATSRSG